ncbi:MAG TPA: DUF3090 family protein [Actinomycetota bacterium]|nr:DUF3090 family protein [Actinomycetota bacterium]
MLIELDPVDRITADAVGEPGDRTFFIQGRKGDLVVTILVEKQQVQLLAASVVEILSRLGMETGQGPAEESMGLEEPIVPEWRAGRLSIGYQEERDLILLEAEELVATEEADDEVDEPGLEDDPLAGLGVELEVADLMESTIEEAMAEEESPVGDAGRVRFWATREQMLSLARHGAAVCAQGRPRCQLCGNPIDPEGHQCPALNGHREGTD